MLNANRATTIYKNKSIFPSNDGSNGWGAIADATNIVRRLVGEPLSNWIK